jgi:hypothetical protein
MNSFLLKIIGKLEVGAARVFEQVQQIFLSMIFQCKAGNE